MTYEDLTRAFTNKGVFVLEDVPKSIGRQMGAPARRNLPRTLHRWVQTGKLTALRRGVYILPGVENQSVMAEEIATSLYGPSYVSGLWGLSNYGLIPEGATEVTSATTKNPATFITPTGRYRYQHIAPRLFFGFDRNEGVLVANREKTLLDFLWWRINDKLHPGFKWTRDEFMRWRLQDPAGSVNEERLISYAKRFRDGRLIAAADGLISHLRDTRMDMRPYRHPVRSKAVE